VIYFIISAIVGAVAVNVSLCFDIWFYP